MTMLNIDFDNFKFEVNPISRSIEGVGGPYMDWLQLCINVTEGGFSGSVHWPVMPTEILKFKQSLAELHQSLVTGERHVDAVEFSGVEPHFRLTISLANSWGHLFAQYILKDSPDGPQLEGSFGLDQSYLQQWIRDMDELLEYHG